MAVLSEETMSRIVFVGSFMNIVVTMVNMLSKPRSKDV